MNCKAVTISLLLLLFLTRVYIQPTFSLISDCDETFNYWEPLNLLVRGFGKQTWEYSPEYSIRSWAFLLPFYCILYPVNKFTDLESHWNFFITRACLGFFSFIMEFKLHREIAGSLALQIANIWIIFQLFNPGWFHASVELLPSAVAMLLYVGATRHSLRYLSTGSTSNFTKSLAYNFLASILGWPFVLVLSLPLCLHYLFNHRIISTIRTAFDCCLIFSLTAFAVIVTDSIFYGKLAPVSWNILFYNVINASEESGPNIFGVEPWYYYPLNLLLNFPLPVLVLATLGIFHLRLWPLWASLFTWIAVFTQQPHKEERFLYPIYGLITLSASIAFYKVLNLFNRKPILKKGIKLSVLLIVAGQAMSRIVALVNNYTAPIAVYEQFSSLNQGGVKAPVVNVCTGREWYHFPSSFLLPDNHRLKFVKSGFDGLLPGDFPESGSIFKKIRTLPKGMNNKNIYDTGKEWPITRCDYFIDIVAPINLTKDVFNPLHLMDNWNKLACTAFIDGENSKILGRAFYVPEPINRIMQIVLPKQWNQMYGVRYIDYCLFEKPTETTN